MFWINHESDLSRKRQILTNYGIPDKIGLKYMGANLWKRGDAKPEV